HQYQPRDDRGDCAHRHPDRGAGRGGGRVVAAARSQDGPLGRRAPDGYRAAADGGRGTGARDSGGGASGRGARQPVTAVAADAAVLACTDITKSYGGVRAVDSVSIEVARQGLFGLCGFNGAGKSTLFNVLAGSARADSGTVRIAGQDATGWSAMRRARSGV